MANRNLILICQSGGEFVKNEDGTLTYTGGEAEAVTVTSETVYDDLKLRLAEMCNFDLKSVSIKYFLPGNTRTLISLSSDKDLKRMLGFQKNSTTADAFVMGEPGFSRESLDKLINRETSVIVWEPVDHVNIPLDTADAHVNRPLDAADPQVDMPLDAGDAHVDMHLDAADPQVDMPLDAGDAHVDMHLDAADPQVDMPLDAADSQVDMHLDAADPQVNRPLDAADPHVDMPLDAADTQVDMHLDAADAQVDDAADSQVNRPLDAADSQVNRPLDAADTQVDMPLDAADSQVDRPLDAATQVDMPLDAADTQVDMPLDAAGPQVTMPLDAADAHVDMSLDAAGPNVASPVRVGSRRKYAARRKALNAEDASPEKKTRKSTPRSSTGAVTTLNSSVASDTADNPNPDATKAPKQSLSEIDMTATPADAVKKRKRASSKKVVSDDAEKGRSRKKNRQVVAVDSEIEQSNDVVCKEEDPETSCHLTDSDDNVPPEEKIASWKRRITGVGQNFKNVQEFRDSLQKYAIAHRFGYRLKKNDSGRATAICISENCSWRILASWVPGAETFTVKKFNNSHTCAEESRKPPHPKKWLEKMIKDKLKESPHLKPKEIADGIAHDYGIELNYSQVWRGFGRAKEQLQGSNKIAYEQLPWYCEKVVEVNPGSFSTLLTDNEKRFQCLFISLHSSIQGFQYGCRPLLFLEATPLKSKYQEVLLTATSLDGNDSFFPVAFAVIDTEKDENWEWFLEQLKTSLPGSGPLTFVYNREKGLRDTVQNVFPDAHHGYSMFHLMESFWRSFKGPFHGEGRSSLPGYFVSAAQTPRLSEFKRCIEQINKIAPKVHNWVQEIEPECWTTTACKGEIHNHVTDNIAKPYMKVIEESKEFFITQKIDAIVNMIVELMSTRRAEVSNCTETLIPSKAETLTEEAVGALGLRVLVSSDTVFEVHDEAIHVVDLTILDCTCMRWQTSGLPCRHAIAVFNFTGRNVHDYCSRYFLAETFMLTYSEPVTAIGSMPSLIKLAGEEEEKDGGEEKEETADSVNVNVNVLPPFLPRSSSAAKEKKAKNPRPIKWVVICSRCKEAGHNKKSCQALV